MRKRLPITTLVALLAHTGCGDKPARSPTAERDTAGVNVTPQSSAPAGPTHASMRTDSVVSLWLGDLPSEPAYEAYFEQHFATDFGFIVDPAAGPEYTVRPKAIPVSDLLGGLSFAETFSDEAVAVAASRGFKTARTAVVFYGLRYRPELIRKGSNAPLTFIGAIEQETAD